MKIVNHFWQSVDAILEDVFVTETIDLKITIFYDAKFTVVKSVKPF